MLDFSTTNQPCSTGHIEISQPAFPAFIGCGPDRKPSAAPLGLVCIFAFFPGFRFASPWAIFWSPPPGLGISFCEQLRNPKVSDIRL